MTGDRGLENDATTGRGASRHVVRNLASHAPGFARGVVMTVLRDLTTLEVVASRVREQLGVATVTISEVDLDMIRLRAIVGERLVQAVIEGSIPLSYSISQHVVAMNYPLIVADAMSHPLMSRAAVISENAIGAYVGAPLHRSDGTCVGALSVFERHRRDWRPEEVEVVVDAAREAEGILNRKRPGAGS
ncbi:GAF domain-containing protein [Sulfitobacter sp. LCG007]